MTTRKDFVIELIVKTSGVDKAKAEQIVDLLTSEGLLTLGFGDTEIDAILDKFTVTFGTTRTSKYDRFAASRLAKKYGSQSIVGIIGLLAENAGERFCPVVNSVSEMEAKMPSVLNFLRNQQGDEAIVTG